MFVGGATDNPNITDKEAGMLSLEAFLDLYDATSEPKWLNRAMAAGNYAESYIWIWNVPMPLGAVDADLNWKRGVPTVGVQGITARAAGGVDEYLDWAVPAYARLYKYTRDEHYLYVARVLLFDTKSMLALPGRTYDLAGPGWQQEHWSMGPNSRGFGCTAVGCHGFQSTTCMASQALKSSTRTCIDGWSKRIEFVTNTRCARHRREQNETARFLEDKYSGGYCIGRFSAGTPVPQRQAKIVQTVPPKVPTRLRQERDPFPTRACRFLIVGATPESAFPPKPPVFAASRLSPEVKVSPMPLAERLRRGIVPRQGFCSTIPGTTVSEGLTSGNGHMNIEVTCDPYSEQILFHHESLLVPWKRPFEAPKAADVFPQVRQMVLDGKYQEAIELAFKEMNKGPIKQNTGPHPTVPAFLMRLDLPKTASVKDYLRTVEFREQRSEGALER